MSYTEYVFQLHIVVIALLKEVRSSFPVSNRKSR